MDGPHARRSASSASSLIALPEYIVNTFIPGAQPLLAKYPTLVRTLGFLLAFWYLEPVARLQSLWSRISTLVVATVAVASDEDLFSYMSAYLYEKKTLRADQKLNAISNPVQDEHMSLMRGRHDSDEESPRNPRQEAKIKYERSRGTEFFFHKGRIFWASKSQGEGHQYYGNRYRRAEVLSISCLGRSTVPIQELMEDVFRVNKDKEKTLTIIRRPHTGGYGNHLSWSRLTSKPRRALDTVVLEAAKKSAVLADIQEYMDEGTATFYGSHGIPYRRGYMFYGPPGTGKTSFALALASKFDLDVYVISLLDSAITDSQLISLFNQLPGRSLLLLEDIDTAGLSKRGPSTAVDHGSLQTAIASHSSPATAFRSRESTGRQTKTSGGRSSQKKSSAKSKPNNATTRDEYDNDNKNKNNPDDDDDDDDDSDDNEDDDSDDEDGTGKTKSVRSRVSLSGLLNAIDGVAAPEGHILIITTNKPYKLDDALVRAGRISVRVAFTNATKAQAHGLFTRMYNDADLGKLGDVNLNALADKFAATLPDQEFSPADLQDYLLGHKKDPLGAVQECPQWILEQAAERDRREAQTQAERDKKRRKKNAKDKEWVESIKNIIEETNSQNNKDEGVDNEAEEGKKVEE